MTFIIVSVSIGLSILFVAGLIEGGRIENQDHEDPPIKMRR